MWIVGLAIVGFVVYLWKAYDLGHSKSPKKYLYSPPKGKQYELFENMLKQSHLLIAGCQGSGKSVVMNGLISDILCRYPADDPEGAQMILIDPKCVEFCSYADLPHTLAYAEGFNPSAWISAMKKAVKIMDERKAHMKGKMRLYDKGDLYVIIDEWATVYKNGGKEAFNLMMRLVSEGRAEKVHVIMATQVPKATIIPTELRENFDARLCLRTANSIQSRVIMEENGCEDLPRYGYGFYVTTEGIDKWDIPYVKPDELQRLVDHWHGPGVQPVK